MLAKFTRTALATWFALAVLGAGAVQAQSNGLDQVVARARTISVPAARASQVERDVSGVLCRTTYNWPSALHRGYFPVRVRLTNQNDDSIVVDLEAETSWGNEDTYTRRVMLSPGQEAEFEMLLRAREIGMNAYRLKVEADGEDITMGGCGPSQMGSRWGGGQNVMIVTAQELSTVKEETLTKEWVQLDKDTEWSSLGDRLMVSTRTFDQLSTSWQAYTSLDTVILDLGVDALPSVSVLKALAAWCRAGGTLVVLGVPAESIAGFPGLGAAVRERFEQFPKAQGASTSGKFLPAHEEFRNKELVAYRVGFGTLIGSRQTFQATSALETDGQGLSLAYVAARANVPEAWSRQSRTGRSTQESIERTLEQFADLPLRTLMVFMVLFALLLGPVNFMWVKRKKNPMLLLASVPVIALVSSVVLLVYGVLAEGLDIRSVTRSWAVLDQGAQTATCTEVRRVFAGSSPGEGLRPQVGTLVMPEARKWRGTHQSTSLFLSDATEGLVLSGDYFPVRSPFAQMIVSDRTSRLRLDAKRVGEEVEVTNALGSEISGLLLRGSNGEYHALKGSLGPGESALLVPTGGQDQVQAWSSDLTHYGEQDGRGLMLGTYIVLLEEATLADDCGVEMDEVDGRHVLMGILDTAEGAF